MDMQFYFFICFKRFCKSLCGRVGTIRLREYKLAKSRLLTSFSLRIEINFTLFCTKQKIRAKAVHII